MKTVLIIYAFFVLGVCSSSNDFGGDNNNGNVGKSGSINTMTIIGDHLFNVNTDRIDNYKIDDAGNMNLIEKIEIDSRLETIYPFNDYILIGSQFGMYMYQLNGEGKLEFISEYRHVRSCDPVVAENDRAYVTLNNTSGGCRNGVNELHILNIEDPRDPVQMAIYEMSNPLGLGVSGDLLFVCDQESGLKVLNVKNPQDIQLKDHVTDVYAKDVIVHRNLVLLITKDSLVIFAYDSGGQLTRLSDLKLKV